MCRLVERKSHNLRCGQLLDGKGTVDVSIKSAVFHTKAVE